MPKHLRDNHHWPCETVLFPGAKHNATTNTSTTTNITNHTNANTINTANTDTNTNTNTTITITITKKETNASDPNYSVASCIAPPAIV